MVLDGWLPIICPFYCWNQLHFWLVILDCLINCCICFFDKGHPPGIRGPWHSPHWWIARGLQPAMSNMHQTTSVLVINKDVLKKKGGMAHDLNRMLDQLLLLWWPQITHPLLLGSLTLGNSRCYGPPRMGMATDGQLSGYQDVLWH